MVAAGALHHIFGRGNEREKNFWDDADHDSLVNCSGKVLTETRGFPRSLNVFIYIYAGLNCKGFRGEIPKALLIMEDDDAYYSF